MAADILFGCGRSWSALTAGFNEIMGRAKRLCGPDDAEIADAFAFAQVVGCLAIYEYQDRNVRIRLTQKILIAAREFVDELTANPSEQAWDIQNLRKLVDMASGYLAELEREAGEGGGAQRGANEDTQ